MSERRSKAVDTSMDSGTFNWKLAVVFLWFSLAFLSWMATYYGIHQFLNTSDDPWSFVISNVPIALACAMIMAMIVWLLRQLMKPMPILLRVILVIVYGFLSLISVGFGFGFYWKFLNARSTAIEHSRNELNIAQGRLSTGISRLNDVSDELGRLARLSAQRAKLERKSGGSCDGQPKKPGDGPIRRLRDREVRQFREYRDTVVSRFDKFQIDQQNIKINLTLLNGYESKSRTQPKLPFKNFVNELNTQLRSTSDRFNDLNRDPALQSIAQELAKRSETVKFKDPKSRKNFECIDTLFMSAIRRAGLALNQLPSMSIEVISSLEDAVAIREAISRLAGSIGLTATKIGRRIFQQRNADVASGDDRQQFTGNGSKSSATVLQSKDIAPLTLAVFVDMCLLVLALGEGIGRSRKVDDVIRGMARGLVDADPRINPEMLALYAVHHNNTDYIVVPSQEFIEEEIEANGWLIGALDLIRDRRYFIRSKLPKKVNALDELQRNGRKLPENVGFHIYRYLRDAQPLLMQALTEERINEMNGPSRIDPSNFPWDPPTDGSSPPGGGSRTRLRPGDDIPGRQKRSPNNQKDNSHNSSTDNISSESEGSGNDTSGRRPD